MYYLKWVPAGLAACLALAGAGILAGAPAVSTSNIASSPLWDDGKAEFSTYVGTTERYGQERPTEARIIVVRKHLAEIGQNQCIYGHRIIFLLPQGSEIARGAIKSPV